jgi:glycosyltransferase involved in cell wall biosynthesis
MSHVGIVALSHPALGGTFQYTLSTIDALRLISGNKYTIYTSVGNDSYDNLGIPIIRIPGAMRSLLSVIWGQLIPGSGGDMFAEVDLVIAPIYTARLLACRRPFVFTIHDLQERYYPANFTIAQRYWRKFANQGLANAAHVILCESNHVKDDIRKFLRIEASKIAVIPAPPMAALSLACPDSQTLDIYARDMNLPDQFIFYPAQFFPHKNHMRLIEAFAVVSGRYPKCYLLLTGQKRYEYAKVMARLTELGVKDRVMHLGYLDTEALGVVYRRATFVVMPTLFESVSIPIYEAFRLGVPVCAANVVALPEQVGDAGLLFDPFSVEDMASKMCDLLGDERLRRDLAVKGRERVRSLTTESYATQLAAVLNKLARDQPRE